MSRSATYFTSLGSVGEVGASAHLIEIDGLQVLLDCGLHPKKDGKDSLPDFSLLRRAPDAVMVSHAHHDHCAGLPYLLKMYHTTVPYATPPTVRIVDRMLHNSVSVMEKMRDERGIEDYPLYNHDDVEFTVRRMYGIPLNQEFAVLPGSDVRVCFSHAGHVLGGACVKITSPDHTILYTGDVCTVDQELLGGMNMPSAADGIDTLIIESTYGMNEAAADLDYNAEIDRFVDGINRVLNREGVVLAPSFALGRTQEILNIIARLQEEGRIPRVPVYGSGLGRAIYEIYNRYSEQLKKDAVLAPLEAFEPVGDVWDPNVVRDLLREPSIIVATSGMMVENTPAAMIAEHLIREERHGIFFVGYCDPDTLGYQVRNAKPGDELVFRTGGKPIPTQLEDIQWYHFSAHADRDELCRVVESVQAKNVIFVHGDPDAIAWMHDNSPTDARKFMPHIGETLELNG